MLDELKSCPFCGGKAKLEDMGYPHHVFCTKCFARVTGQGYAEEGEQDAIRKWNSRVNERTVIQNGKSCINITNAGVLNL